MDWENNTAGGWSSGTGFGPSRAAQGNEAGRFIAITSSWFVACTDTGSLGQVADDSPDDLVGDNPYLAREYNGHHLKDSRAQ